MGRTRNKCDLFMSLFTSHGGSPRNWHIGLEMVSEALLFRTLARAWLWSSIITGLCRQYTHLLTFPGSEVSAPWENIEKRSLFWDRCEMKGDTTSEKGENSNAFFYFDSWWATTKYQKYFYSFGTLPDLHTKKRALWSSSGGDRPTSEKKSTLVEEAHLWRHR